jgi:hypothetical protein
MCQATSWWSVIVLERGAPASALLFARKSLASTPLKRNLAHFGSAATIFGSAAI